MRLHLAAVGRIRPDAPERALIEDYAMRFDRTARPLGMGPLVEHEVEPRRGSGPTPEAEALVRALPDGAALVALDERGRMLTSRADGLDPALRDRADLVLSFGPMVWPHMLARVMLVEQLYRAATILAGSPYHRA
ncbi:MAG: 23S rRNA (pseudouridine(1915)-N(3))-methyltransferase RlmH [Rhodobacteraceae bacterium]|nr:23S rRNA (pseudouridine(1915)-N(3))-methyltransferase RlmH [Paracoccaceae bacterium]